MMFQLKRVHIISSLTISSFYNNTCFPATVYELLCTLNRFDRCGLAPCLMFQSAGCNWNHTSFSSWEDFWTKSIAQQSYQYYTCCGVEWNVFLLYTCILVKFYLPFIEVLQLQFMFVQQSKIIISHYINFLINLN